jgi:hypothetical protein
LRLCREFRLVETRRYAGALRIAAIIAVRRGHFEDARRAFADGLALMVHLRDAVGATTASHSLAGLALLLGDTERALDLATAAAEGARRARFTQLEAIALTNAAACSLVLGDAEGARVAAREALEIAQGAYAVAATAAIQHLATVAALRGDARLGARLGGYADAWYRNGRGARDEADTRGNDMLTASLRQQLTDAQIAGFAAEGAALTEEQASVEARAV